MICYNLLKLSTVSNRLSLINGFTIYFSIVEHIRIIIKSDFFFAQASVYAPRKHHN